MFSLVNLVAAGRPSFSYFQSYLFLSNAKLFLRGFALDMPPGGCYVWKYMFPIFADLEFISLTFGYRLLDVYVDRQCISPHQAASSVISIIDSNLDFAETESFDEFLSFVQDTRIDGSAKAAAIALVEKAIDMGPVELERIIENNKTKYGLGG